MTQDGYGSGKLVPSGHSEPAIDVTFNISRAVAERPGPHGERVQWQKATVHSLETSVADSIPNGDFDLLADGGLLRLKHVPADPTLNLSRWLVLSSI